MEDEAAENMTENTEEGQEVSDGEIESGEEEASSEDELETEEDAEEDAAAISAKSEDAKTESSKKEPDADYHAELRRYRDELDNFKRESYQQQAWLQQQAIQQQQELFQQLSKSQAELEYLRKAKETEQEKDLDPVERLKRDIERSARENAMQAFRPEIESLRGAHDKFLEQQKNMQEEHARQQRIQGYLRDTDLVTNELLDGIDSKVSGGIKKNLEEMVLIAAIGSNMSPRQVGVGLKNTMLQYASAYMRSKSKHRERLENVAKLPERIPPSRVHTKGKSIPSEAQLKKMGFKDHLDFVINQ